MSEQIQQTEERVQKKLLDLFFKGLSALMLPVLIWAYSVSLDIAIIKDSVSDLEGDLGQESVRIKTNTSSISTNNSKIGDLKYVEKYQKKMEKDLDDTKKSLEKIHIALVKILQKK
jgi:hypothetical protein